MIGYCPMRSPHETGKNWPEILIFGHQVTREHLVSLQGLLPGLHLAQQRSFAAQNSLQTKDSCQSSSGQGSLSRGRDFARQRWPFGQHKLTVCHWLGPPCPGPCVGFAGGLAL